MTTATNQLKDRALQLYPDPINGSASDKEDFELRKWKAKLQRDAYIKGVKEQINYNKK
jgi:hypothetical protein